ncbi:SGNH/GDSL hydrolase family protein [Paraburkholderia sp. SEWSISQ10-3 4]|uniref:SGNH/GDSL hydrolase family protein n=1 Tax=Paraburkholderia TaxID=1822464 RepID=UPI002255EAC1|nr:MULTISPECIES: SGNH/GDSL hydrolase family protein [Paraburkholderia]MCX4138986.1 SGNH/GDSL hydrolase family protein [Paraburkholderia aspalathi]MDN7171676.1 SGNH/GDSL hydrolase family protein [Paraburkholderia sp. SEWSISQ10-3 4]MDQ6501315.1 SGNH/GDSL hydrolase family protein [Paraburkholderia aspalathi]
MRRRAWLAAGVSAAASVLVSLTLDAHASGPASQVLVDAYGDSTTLGITCSEGHCGPQAQNAVSYLQDELQARYGQKVHVTNYGVGGTMASQLRDGTGNRRAGPTAGLPWQERLAASSAQIVLINYGINEVMQNQTPELFYAAETTLVKTARALGKEPVLQTSNPMPDNHLNARLAAMVAMTRRVAAEQQVPLVDQFAYVSNLPDWKTLMSDGAHPKPGLYRLKAEQDFQVVDPLVRRLLDGTL